MNALEKIVTSLEMSKKMRNAGIDFETALFWVKPNNENKWYLVTSSSSMFQQPHKYYKAYTAGEMMRALPDKIIVEKNIFYLELIKVDGIYAAQYNLNSCSWLKIMNAKTPEEALSKLCLWCRKEGYL
jgi:hypothetical protein